MPSKSSSRVTESFLKSQYLQWASSERRAVPSLVFPRLHDGASRVPLSTATASVAPQGAVGESRAGVFRGGAPFQPTAPKANYIPVGQPLVPRDRPLADSTGPAASSLPSSVSPSSVSTEGLKGKQPPSRRTSSSSSQPSSSMGPIPSAREIHEVIAKATARGDWRQAVQLFTGALQLQCLPLNQTHELVLLSVIQGGGLAAAVPVIDRIAPTTASMASFYSLSIRIWWRSATESHKNNHDSSVKPTTRRLNPNNANDNHNHDNNNSSSSSSSSISTKVFALQGDQWEELIHFVEEAFHRRILLEESVRMELWRSLLQAGRPETIISLCHKAQMACSSANERLNHRTSKHSSNTNSGSGGITGTENTTEEGEHEHTIILGAPSSPISFWGLHELRHLMQAAGRVGDIHFAMLLARGYLKVAPVDEPALAAVWGGALARRIGQDAVAPLPPRTAPADIVVASFGAAFFQHLADHKGDLRHALNVWMSAIFWLQNFPRSEVAVKLEKKMKDELRRHRDASVSLCMTMDMEEADSGHGVMLKSENVYKLCSWCRTHLGVGSGSESALCDSSIAPKLTEVASSLHLRSLLPAGPHAEEIINTLQYLVIMEEQRGKGTTSGEVSDGSAQSFSLPLTALSVILTLVMPSLSTSIWNVYPSAWWKAEVTQDGKRTYAWAYIVDLCTRSCTPDFLEPLLSTSPAEPSRAVLVAGYVAWAEVLLRNIMQHEQELRSRACSNTGNEDPVESFLSSVVFYQKKRQLLDWVVSWMPKDISTGSSPWNREEREKVDFAIVSLLASAGAPLAFVPPQGDFIRYISENFSLALMGIDMMTQTASQVYTPKRMLNIICAYLKNITKNNEKDNRAIENASETFSASPVSGLLIAYVLKLEQRCEMSPELVKLVEQTLKFGKGKANFLPLAQLYALMKYQWDGTTGAYYRVVLPLLMEKGDYQSALDIMQDYPLSVEEPVEGRVDNKVYDGVGWSSFVCHVHLAPAQLKKAMTTQNGGAIKSIFDHLVHLLSELRSRRLDPQGKEDGRRMIATFLQEEMTQAGVLYLMESGAHETVRAVLDAFCPPPPASNESDCSPSVREEAEGDPLSVSRGPTPVWQGLQLYWRVRNTCALHDEQGLITAKAILRASLDPLIGDEAETPGTDRPAPYGWDLSYYLLGAAALLEEGYAHQAYAFIRRVLKSKREWEREKLREEGQAHGILQSTASSSYSVPVSLMTEERFEEDVFLPSEHDIVSLGGASYVLRAVAKVLDTLVRDLLQLKRNRTEGSLEAHRGADSIHTPVKHMSLRDRKLKCHEICFTAAFFLPILQKPEDVQVYADMFQRWRTTTSEDVTSDQNVCMKLMSAGAGRLAMQLLYECQFRALPVPLCLLHAATTKRFLTAQDWQAVANVLQSSVLRLPASEKADQCVEVVREYYKSLSKMIFRAAQNLLSLRQPLSALKTLRVLNPFQFQPLSTEKSNHQMAPLCVADILTLVTQVASKRRESDQLYQQLVENAFSNACSASASSVSTSLRDTILQFVQLGCPREAFLLLRRGLERRRVGPGRSVHLRVLEPKDMELGDAEEDYFDVTLMALVLEKVAAEFPWKATLRCWMLVHHLVPFVHWSAYDGGRHGVEAFQALLNAMISQDASALEVIQVVRLGIVQFGMPPSASTTFSQSILKALSTQPKLTVAERLHCQSLLTAIRDHQAEMKIIQVIESMCGQPVSTSPPYSSSLSSSLVSSRAAAPTMTWNTRRSSTSWLAERPVLTHADLRLLSTVAPLVLMGTTRQLETISQKYFQGRWLAFELKPLLFAYEKSIVQQIREWDRETRSRPGYSEAASADGEDQVVPHQAVLVETLSHMHSVLVRLSDYVSQYQGVSAGNRTVSMWTLEESKRQGHKNKYHKRVMGRVEEWWCNMVIKDLFHFMIPQSTARALWKACQSRVLELSKHRWSPAVEAELRQQVWERCGKPPVSLVTAPKLTRRAIEHYWSLYHTVLLPELCFDAAELCCLAHYAPELSALHQSYATADPAGYRAALWELAAVIQTAHFGAEAIPGEEFSALFRRPRSVAAIHAVLSVGRKKLLSLHHQLRADARSTRYLFRCYGRERHLHSYVPANPAVNIWKALVDETHGTLTSQPVEEQDQTTHTVSHHSVAPATTTPHVKVWEQARQHLSRTVLMQRARLACAIFTSEHATPWSATSSYLESQGGGCFSDNAHHGAVREVRAAWEAVLRDDGSLSPIVHKSQQDAVLPPSVAVTPERLLAVSNLLSSWQTRNGSPPTPPSWVLLEEGKKVSDLLQQENSPRVQDKIQRHLNAISDPLLTVLVLLHVNSAAHHTSVPVEVSQALLEHVKYVVHQNESRQVLFTAAEMSSSASTATLAETFHFFTTEEDAYYRHKPFVDLVHMWNALTLGDAWKYVHVSKRSPLSRLIAPSQEEAASLPTKYPPPVSDNISMKEKK